MSTFEEDMKRMTEEVTQSVVLKINRTPQLYNEATVVLVDPKYDKEQLIDKLVDIVYKYADEHDGVFGAVFEAELDAVDWGKVLEELL